MRLDMKALSAKYHSYLILILIHEGTKLYLSYSQLLYLILKGKWLNDVITLIAYQNKEKSAKLSHCKPLAIQQVVTRLHR